MVIGVLRSFVMGTYFSCNAKKQFTELGLPCPPHGPTQIAVPALGEAPPSQGGLPSDGAVGGSANLEPDAPAEPAEPSDVPADDVEVVKDPRPKGTLEEAQSWEHQMTHLQKNPLRRLL